MKAITKYLWNIAFAVDQLINAIFLGDPDETISSRIGKMIRRGTEGWIPRKLNWLLDKIDKNHCRDAIEEDEGKDDVYNMRRNK